MIAPIKKKIGNDIGGEEFFYFAFHCAVHYGAANSSVFSLLLFQAHTVPGLKSWQDTPESATLQPELIIQLLPDTEYYLPPVVSSTILPFPFFSSDRNVLSCFILRVSNGFPNFIIEK